MVKRQRGQNKQLKVERINLCFLLSCLAVNAYLRSFLNIFFNAASILSSHADLRPNILIHPTWHCSQCKAIGSQSWEGRTREDEGIKIGGNRRVEKEVEYSVVSKGERGEYAGRSMRVAVRNSNSKRVFSNHHGVKFVAFELCPSSLHTDWESRTCPHHISGFETPKLPITFANSSHTFYLARCIIACLPMIRHVLRH